jgi:endo-alpha-1,4-polygalactosaminidase (GH114 family)
MRRFISSISAYARKNRPGFTVLTLNGLDLLTKTLAGDETKRYPARAYIRSVDGVIQESTFFGVPTVGSPSIEERKTPLLRHLDTAKANRLPVLAIEYAKTPKMINDAIRLTKQKGFIPFISPARPLSDLPTYPRRPINENPKSVISLSEIKNFLYLPESTGFGREDEYALALHGTNYDMLIVDVFHGRTLLSKRAVETMKYKKIGAKRLVLARLNIGTAEAYRYYWKPGWREGSPPWIGPNYPTYPDRYYVQFWKPEWQALISGDARSYMFGIMQQGYDGVLLDGIETYRYYEGTAESVEATR